MTCGQQPSKIFTKSSSSKGCVVTHWDAPSLTWKTPGLLTTCLSCFFIEHPSLLLLVSCSVARVWTCAQQHTCCTSAALGLATPPKPPCSGESCHLWSLLPATWLPKLSFFSGMSLPVMVLPPPNRRWASLLPFLALSSNASGEYAGLEAACPPPACATLSVCVCTHSQGLKVRIAPPACAILSVCMCVNS